MARMILAPALGSSRFAPAPSVPRRKFLGGLLAGLAGGTLLGKARDAFGSTPSVNSTTPFLGEISMVGFNFAPVGWALCNGALLPISTNTALFTLIGTYFGGDGVSNFALPDFRGRFPIHIHPTLYPYPGMSGGESAHTLTAAELPPHGHTLGCDTGNGTSDSPAGLYPARNPAGVPTWSGSGASSMAAGAIGGGGSGAAHNNLPPYLSINFIIAIVGTYPSHA